MKVKTIFKRLLNKTLIEWVLIPLFLLILCYFFSLFFNRNHTLSTFVYPHSYKEYTHFPSDGFLIKNEYVRGEFQAKEDNLGIIAVKTTLNDDINKQYIEFRVKEKQSSEWYYDNTYPAQSINEGGLLIFGFPKISNSRYKQYVFEIVSLNGNGKNKIKLVSRYDSFTTRYIYLGKNLSSKLIYLDLISRKIAALLSYPDELFWSVIFTFPTIFYLLLIGPIGTYIIVPCRKWIVRALGIKITFDRKIVLKLVILLLITLDGVLLKDVYYGVTIDLFQLWLLLIVKYKIRHTVSLLFSFIFLMISEFFMIPSWILNENKIAMWAYFFLAIAIVQLIINEIKNKSHVFFKD